MKFSFFSRKAPVAFVTLMAILLISLTQQVSSVHLKMNGIKQKIATETETNDSFNAYAAEIKLDRIDSVDDDDGVSNMEFVLSDALKFVHYAAYAYCESQTEFYRLISNITYIKDFRINEFDSDVTKKTQTYVGYDSATNRIIVSFRGTIGTLKDYLDDAEFNLIHFEGLDDDVKIHMGFYDSYYNQLFKVVRRGVAGAIKNHPTADLYIIGHSLGGAMAAICAVDLFLLGYRPKTFTFGQPRVGNTQFAAFMNKNVDSIRMTHNHDVVVHLPPTLIGYEHHKGEVYQQFGFKDMKDIIVCKGNEDLNCSDSVYGLSVFDHKHYLGIHVECVPDGHK